MSKQDRSGFTLVELLVVITIIGMLVGLLVPAVISVREAGRQTQCMNNQHELQVAIFNYEIFKKRYPGYLNSKGRTWPMVLLKDLGMVNLHREFLTGGGGGVGGVGGVGGGAQATEAEIKQFICPDDKLGELGSLLSYVANTGRLGPDKPAKAYGIFHDLSDPANAQTMKVSSSDILDGASQTLLIAERGNDLNQSGVAGGEPRQWTTGTEESLGFYWGGASGKARDHLRSYHPDISVVTFCGGNVKKQRLNIDYNVYCLLMTPDGAKAGQTGALKEGDY